MDGEEEDAMPENYGVIEAPAGEEDDEEDDEAAYAQMA